MRLIASLLIGYALGFGSVWVCTEDVYAQVPIECNIYDNPEGCFSDDGRWLVTSPNGDDNHDGIIDEDESGWDCATMGNRRCG